MSVVRDADARLAQPLDRLDLRAVLVLLVCCACWGINQSAIKIANAGISPTLQVGLRSICAGVLVLAWAQLRGVRLFERDGTLWPGLLAGLMFAVEFMVLYVGLDRTTASRGVMLLYLSPFVVALGAHYLIPGDRLTLVKVVGLTAALAGLAGGLEAHLTFLVAPSGYGFGRVVDMLVQAVVGGVAHFGGPVLGAAFLTLLPEGLREVSHLTGMEPGPLRLLANGLVLLAVILFLPNGLVSLPGRLRAWRDERRAARALVD